MPQISDKYTIKDNTFFLTANSDLTDKIDIEVGDSKTVDKFLPQLKILRWHDENNFSIRLINTELNPQVETENEMIKWIGDKTETRFYDVPEGYEFEVILKEKPAVNKIEFTMQNKGLTFYHQPSSIQTPENIINSYAIYCSENKINYIGKKLYKSGKFGHIYRPKIIDSVGNWTWGILNIDPEQGILSVEIPQDFLDKAVYPIKHAAGLTFGTTAVGGGVIAIGTDATLIGVKTFSPAAGTLTHVNFYLNNTSGTNAIVQVGIYDSSWTLLGSSADITLTPGSRWISGAINASLSAGSYWLGFWSSTGKVNNYYDFTAYADTNWNDGGKWPNPWLDWNQGTWNTSCYGTYTIPETSKTIASRSKISGKGIKISTSQSKIQILVALETKSIVSQNRIKYNLSRTTISQSRIRYNYFKTLSSQTKVKFNINATFLSQSRIKYNFSIIMNSTLRIYYNLTKTTVSQSRIKLNNNQIIASQSRVKLNSIKIISSQSRLKYNLTKTINFQSVIKTLSVKTITSQSRIGGLIGTKTITSISNIKAVNTIIKTSQSRISKTSSQIIVSQSRVKIINIITKTSQSRIKYNNVQIITSQSRIRLNNAVILTSQSKIRVISIKTITSQSKIFLKGTAVITSQCRVRLNSIIITTSQSKVKISGLKTVTSQTRIRYNYNIISTSISSIKMFSSKTVSSQSKIKISGIKTITSYSNIFNTVLAIQTIVSQSRIFKLPKQKERILDRHPINRILSGRLLLNRVI